MNFKMIIKKEVSQYTILKDEKYFEAFKMNLLVTATTHSCEEVLDPLTCLDTRKKERIILQSDMGKTTVRKHAATLDVQSVWTEFESHISTSSKGLNER